MASPRKFLVLAKVESQQFTDATPTDALNAILVKNLRMTPIRIESEDRGLIRPYFGNSEQLLVLEEAAIEFDVEFAGGGTPLGTVPKWGPLLRGCGFSETVNASTSVVYAPVSSAFEYLTIYAYRDGWLYKILGAGGTVSIAMAARRIPTFHFRFVGKYSPVTDASLPLSPVYTGFQTPLASLPANTGTLTIGGYAAKVSQFTADMAVDISHAMWMNNETLQVSDRKPKGQITYEAVTVASKNYFSLIHAGTTSAFTLTHGTVAGNILTLAAPKLQLVDLAEVDFEGALAYQSNITLNPNAGNDEVTITCT